MRLLIDTHFALWSVDAPHRLPARAREAMEAADECVVSIITVWEAAIKHALRNRGPDPIRLGGREAWAVLQQAGFTLLPVAAAHAAAIDDLPPLHADPFDRMLIAQARVEGVRLLTADRRLEAYGAPVMLV